jgi:hypothetical protein
MGPKLSHQQNKKQDVWERSAGGGITEFKIFNK